MKLFGLLAVMLLGNQTLVSRREGWWGAKVEIPTFSAKGSVARAATKRARQEARARFDQFVAEAKRNLPGEKRVRSEAQYELEMKPTVALDTSRLASAYWETYAFFAGAHGTTSYKVLNIGFIGGKVRELRLRDLFRKGHDPIRESNKAVIQALKKQGPPSGVQSGEWKGLTKMQSEQFVVTRKGLLWLFDSYELGAYAEGTFKVLVPFDRIAGLDRSGILESAWKRS